MAWLRLVSVLFFAVWSSVATAETRLALVVGNAAYSHVPALANPINDASDIANALRHLGFQVITALNTDRLALERAIRQFSQRLSEAKADETVALFFYAGHGIEVADRNFLIPIDAELKQEIDLDLQTVPVDLVLHQIETRARVGLVFLDACRDNPFVRSLARSMRNRDVSVSSGLASVDAAEGMLIAYATAPKRVAADGTGRNSPFTAALLANMLIPDLDVQAMLRRVRATVKKATNGRQVPWESSSLTSDFMFTSATSSVALVSATEANRRGQEAEGRKDYAEALRWYRQAADKDDLGIWRRAY